MQSVTEMPLSFQVAVFLSSIGALIKRHAYTDQLRWKVWPNMSVMLVGPSGIGKDRAIAEAEWLLRSQGYDKFVGGRTIEGIYEQLVELGDPAACTIKIPEMSSFFGQKDYQKGMVQEFTDMLSTNEYLDVSTKSNPNRIVLRPTITVMAGSTEEWLHSNMPSGSLEGGFFPRFLIVCEDLPSRHIPWVKYSLGAEEVIDHQSHSDSIPQQLKEILHKFRVQREWFPVEEARDRYAAWYNNRMKIFSPKVAAYANRSRDMALRLAMLMAISRGNNIVQEDDIIFGIEFVNYLAERIERAIKPPTLEGKCGRDIIKILPAPRRDIYRYVKGTYTLQVIKNSMDLLIGSGEMKVSDHGIYERVKGD